MNGGTFHDLACRYARERTSELLDELCTAMLPYVRRMAARMHRRLPSGHSIDDLVGDGCLGLLRAADRFDPSYGIPFEAWCERIVRGSMLNGLRTMDLLPERVRRASRRVEAARWALAQTTHDMPTIAGVAALEGLSAEQCERIRFAMNAKPLSLDARERPHDEGGLLGDRLASEMWRSPEDVALEADVARRLAAVVETLPARQRAIIRAFYAQTETFGQIGQRMGVSKQRVQQLHARAISVLRAKLAHWRNA